MGSNLAYCVWPALSSQNLFSFRRACRQLERFDAQQVREANCQDQQSKKVLPVLDPFKMICLLGLD